MVCIFLPVLKWCQIETIMLLDDTDSLKHFKLKSTPTPTVKQRPWSMVSSEHKSGDLSLLSDGTSPITSTGNTPDSGDALDSSESSSIDKRITKDLKAKKTGTSM